MIAMEPSWRRQQTPSWLKWAMAPALGILPPGCASPTGTVEDSVLLSAQAYAECKDDVDYFPPENTPGSEELLTSRAPDDLVPRPMPWPQRWIDLVDDFRRESGTRRSKIWEIFSGTAGLTKEFAAGGWPTGPPIDVVTDPNYNLLNPMLMAIAVVLYAKDACSYST